MRIAIKPTHGLEEVVIGAELRSLGHEVVFIDRPSMEACEHVDVCFVAYFRTEADESLLGLLRDAILRVPPLSVIVFVSPGDRDFAARARLAGATDVLFLPPEMLEIRAELQAKDSSHLLHRASLRDFQKLRETALVGEDSEFKRCLEELLVAARSDANVLLLGETGTGKEMFTRAIHAMGTRATAGKLVAVNCANLPAGLLESELFGHSRGAFTGADRTRIGRFEDVGPGTLLLDEIGDLDLSLQTKLLRVIDQRRFQRLGDNADIEFRARLICATSVNLPEAVERGSFRKDLLGRIDQLKIVLPPLRNRKLDIPLLARSFLAKHDGGAGVELSDSARRLLEAFSFPLNVRQLENFIVSAIAHALPRRVILPRDLPEDVQQQSVVADVAATQSFAVPANLSYQDARDAALRAVDRVYLPTLLSSHFNNQSSAAQAAGIDRKTFATRYRKALGQDLGDNEF